MAAFEIFKGKNGRYYFKLKATNGQIILSGSAYDSKDDTMKAVKSVFAQSSDDANFERKESKDGQYFFVLKSENGETLGYSELYASRAGRELGINAVKRNSKIQKEELENNI